MMQYFSFSRERARWVLICAALLLTLTSLGTAQAQDQVSEAPLYPPAATAFTEPFDDASQFTTSTPFFSDEDVSSGFDYFGIAGTSPDWGGDSAPSGLKAYTGFTGNYLAGMDLDGEGATLPIVVDWTSLDITGLSDLTFEGDFAEFFEDGGDIDDADYIRLTYQIDGGGYQNLLWFSGADFSSSTFNGIFRQDTNFDGTGDGTALGDAAQTFSAAIAGTGTTLDLRMEVSVNSGDEDFAVDNFTVFEDTGIDTTPPSVTQFSPMNNATDVAVDAVISLTFDEDIQFGSGGVGIGDTGGIFANYPDITNTPEITIVNGNTLAIDPTQNFDDPESYFVVIDDGAITDTAATPNAYGGLGIAEYTFSTGSAPLTPISSIQGSGNDVVDTTTTFNVQAIVVGDHQEADEFDGFFIQEEDADADGDPATSEGIFVYCGNGGGNCPDVAYGDLVTVTGTASEFFGMSQLNPSDSSDVVIDSSNNTIPTPASISFPVPAPSGGVDYLERFEGMYVTVDTPMAITEYFNYDRFGEILLWTDGTVSTMNSVRPYQFTAQNAPDATGFQNYLDTFDTRTITLDDGSGGQNVLPAPYPPGDFSPSNSFRGGDVVTGLDGVLNFAFSRWRVQGYDPSADAETDGNPSLTFTDLNDRPATPPTLATGNLRVASFNVLNYFNGDGQGGGFPTARGADTANEFDRQRTKIIEAICLLDADIVGLNEIENDYSDGANSAIADLVSGLNASATCGNRTYDYVDPGANIGTDAIAVGFVYDTNVVSLLQSPDNPAVLDDNAPFITGTVFDGLNSNRNPLAATFIDNNEGELTVIVNHFKSKGGSGTGDNADQDDGQGNWNARRTAASQAILDWIALSPTGSSDDDYLIVGDLNAYDEEDPVTTLESNGFTDLVNQYQGDDAYGYVFSGQWGYLDYALSNAALDSQITDAAIWNINADEPDALDYDESFNPSSWYEPNQYRSSDHDPVVVEIQLVGAGEPPTPNINLLQNPMFSNGITGWGLNGQYEFSIVNGVLEFYRQRPGWRGAVLFQAIDEAIPAGAPMRVNVSLGNNSSEDKSVQILLRSGDFQDVISCSVTIPANSFLRGVTIEDVTSTDWASALFSVRVYDQDGLAAVRVDNTIVQYVPTSGITDYRCSGYDTPEGTNLMRNGDFSTGLLEWILFGDYEFTINNSVLEFYRPAAATNIATLFQYIAGNVDTGAPLQTQLELGNNSSVEKTVSVIVRNADWSDFFRCDYTIPANTPLSQVTVLGTTSVPWSDATLLVRALDADGEAAVRVDNASFVYDTTLDTSTQCSTPSFSAGDTAEIPDGMKAPTTIIPDAGSQLDTDGAAPAPVAPPNPGGLPEIPGF